MPNALYFGDNLEVLRKHIPDESVDLVYLDQLSILKAITRRDEVYPCPKE
ncbi:MAG: hypothetical protein JRG73_13680 [Deltaproteobacteria bacterium]|nr:hypothetical protein [Deltaproteobacteria bacterium]